MTVWQSLKKLQYSLLKDKSASADPRPWNILRNEMIFFIRLQNLSPPQTWLYMFTVKPYVIANLTLYTFCCWWESKYMLYIYCFHRFLFVRKNDEKVPQSNSIYGNCTYIVYFDDFTGCLLVYGHHVCFELKKGNNIMSPVPNVYTISFNFVFIDASLNGVSHCNDEWVNVAT